MADAGTFSGPARRAALLSRRTVVRVWLLVTLLLLWELRATNSPSLFVPEVSAILTRCRELWFGGPATHLFLSDEFFEHVGPSISRMLRGWTIAVAVALPLGIALGVSRRAEWLLNPVVRFGMATPSVMLLPLAITLFGLGDAMNIFVIALGCVWTVLISTVAGVRAVDRVALLSARSMRLSRFDSFRYVLVPGASPQIVAGLRVSLGIALIVMVSSELFAATEGVGRFILSSQQAFRFLDVWAGIFLVGVLGLLVNVVFGAAERRLLRWHFDSRNRK
jgi:ABC-type nitrate/sulfonate/bicarbonate transport system permease component